MKRSSLISAGSSSVSTAKPRVKRSCTTTCSTSESRTFACASAREMRAVMPGASRPVNVRISSPTPIPSGHLRSAGPALPGSGRDQLEALRAALGRRRRGRLLHERLDEQEYDQGDHEEVDDAAQQVAVLDGVLPREHDLGIAPLAAGQHEADDRHHQILHDARHDPADRRADHDAYRQRERVLLEEELPELLRRFLYHTTSIACRPPGRQAVVVGCGLACYPQRGWTVRRFPSSFRYSTKWRASGRCSTSSSASSRSSGGATR